MPAAHQTTAPAAANVTAPARTDAAPIRAADVNDPFELIRALARRAYDGDGVAQYRIARELDRCEATLSAVRSERDPEAAIWSWGFQWTQAMKEWSIAEYRRCRRLLTEDPFAELPRRDGGYNAQYWMQRAFESAHPMAVTARALDNLGSLRAHAATPGNIDHASELDALRKAAMSGDPDVLLRMGLSLWQLEEPARNTRGAALMLAACRAGANCGYDSDVFPFEMCYRAGHQECGPGASIENLLSRAAKPEDFARAYADSQQIEEALRNRDPDAFKPWLDLF